MEPGAGRSDIIDLREQIIYRCIVGSRAYGLAEADSDTDWRGIYLPPAEVHWSLAGVPEQLGGADARECYWELRKFLILALRADPNALESLYTPFVEHATPLAEELLAMRGVFLSRQIHRAYNGYVRSQLRKINEDVRRTRGTSGMNYAMHMIRVLLSGIVALREGRVVVDVGEHRERLLAIRHGAMPWEEIEEWRIRLHTEFNTASARTRLPKQPDHARADAFLIAARRSMVQRW